MFPAQRRRYCPAPVTGCSNRRQVSFAASCWIFWALHDARVYCTAPCTGLVKPRAGASLSREEPRALAPRISGGTCEADPTTDRRFQPGRLAVPAGIVQRRGGAAFGARGGANL